MTHIDLFSGIGGFALAAQWADFRTVVFCEKDEFCQKVITKHWPNIPIVPDIGDFDGTAYRGATLLTGGFPCQPFSQAGQRRGTEDDRHLWPEMLRIIAEARPRWVLGENVAGIINMELDTVLADLEGEGYEVGTVVIPACAKNAPHRRDRVWIIANSKEPGGGGILRRKWGEEGVRGKGVDWGTNWLEVATEFCRVDDGVSDRVHRLKALGNAIVPQVAYEIMRHMT